MFLVMVNLTIKNGTVKLFAKLYNFFEFSL
jgi:hypothetical protein